jgi:uncharacterized membrane protein YhaH (DUF805 family)
MAIKNYANFKDRATRKEYWMFFLFNILVQIGLGIISGILGLGEVLIGLFGLFMFVPSISIAARRLHDIGKSGWWQLIALIPIIGFLVLLFFLVSGSDEDNKFGKKRTADLEEPENDVIKKEVMSVDE